MASPPSTHVMAMLLLALGLQADASQPTAVRKLSPDVGQKIFAEHLAFPDDCFGQETNSGVNGTTEGCLRPAYLRHNDYAQSLALRRAIELPSLFDKRAACPAGMNSCAAQGSPNKCCQEGTYCTDVPDALVGHVACCPRGTQCGGQVGSCPSDAVSCPPALGGGCCISGYVCRGSGCVPSAAASTPAQTRIQYPLPIETVTSTQTTVVDGNPSTIIVTEIVTITSSTSPTSKATATTTPSEVSSGVGIAPWRPTDSSVSASTTTPSPSGGPGDASNSTQQGCPTGFYGCLATHGGGCCRTDRDCQTHSCPAPASTTVVSNGETVVVPLPTGATGADATATASATCANGWFLCGRSAGPEAGCCPSGFDCGSASCFARASQTGSVQKTRPKQSGGQRQSIVNLAVSLCVASWAGLYALTG
ncbi:hypothetical protein HIM_01027 [Hirsutella minnesotensis 3608]|nr:hypothetical protein HIM_01027 [Hirsutella minnesotensis 3608]